MGGGRERERETAKFGLANDLMIWTLFVQFVVVRCKFIYIYIYIYIEREILKLLVFTKSICKLVSKKLHYNMESAQYLG